MFVFRPSLSVCLERSRERSTCTRKQDESLVDAYTVLSLSSLHGAGLAGMEEQYVKPKVERDQGPVASTSRLATASSLNNSQDDEKVRLTRRSENPGDRLRLTSILLARYQALAESRSQGKRQSVS